MTTSSEAPCFLTYFFSYQIFLFLFFFFKFDLSLSLFLKKLECNYFTPVFITALFPIASTGKPKCPMTDE